MLSVFLCTVTAAEGAIYPIYIVFTVYFYYTVYTIYVAYTIYVVSTVDNRNIVSTISWCKSLFKWKAASC